MPGEVAGTSRRFPVNLRADCVDIVVKGCIPILRVYPYTLFFEAVVAGAPEGLSSIYLHTLIFGLFISSELCPIPSDFGRTHHIQAYLLTLN